MEIHSDALIISYLKYGESSAIVRFYSRDKGFVALMWKGVFSPKNKQRSLLSPLNEVAIHYRDKEADTLTYLKKIEFLEQPFLYELNIEKNTLLLFLSEILQSVLQNEPQQTELYDFLTQQIKEFKQQDQTQLWVQKFLLQLSKYLGFMPIANYQDDYYFDLESGVFNATAVFHSLNKNDSSLWGNFLTEDSKDFTGKERLRLLQILLQYYSRQISNFKQPKSLEIIKEIFTS